MEVDFLKRIVKESEKFFQQDFDVRQKDDRGDLVTDLDIEIEKFLIEQINREYPDFGIVSEEFNADGQVTDNCFIIDPIDGTINFANDIPLWGTQIACRKNGETVASVINLPKFGELYYADKTGAYLNDKKISVREVPIKNAVYSIMARDSLSATEKVRSYSRNHRYFGAACISYAYMACGRIHGVNFRLDNHPWDCEPGLFLCKMAGAKVKNERGFRAAAMNQEFLDILEKETVF